MKIILWLLFFCITNTGFAQKDSLLSEPEAYFSAIIVQNMDSSIAWYSEKLRFEILDQTELKERGIRQANLKSGNILLELIELQTVVYPKTILKDQPPKTRIAGFFKFGIQVADFDQWLEHLTKTEAHFHGTVVRDTNSGKRMVLILDPDGNRIQLFEKNTSLH